MLFPENIFACLHFEKTSVFGSLLKVVGLHFRVSWARFVYNLRGDFRPTSVVIKSAIERLLLVAQRLFLAPRFHDRGCPAPKKSHYLQALSRANVN